MSEKQLPPIGLEQWLSWVVALPSHRSNNAGHRDFGTRLVKLVFEDVPAKYDEDQTARAYFNNMLSEVAWAVRGFSNIRDSFQRNVDAFTAQGQHERTRFLGWKDDFSPLRAKSIGKQIVSLAVGAGGATKLHDVFPGIPIGWNVLVVVLIAYVAHFILDALEAILVKRSYGEEPKRAMESWSIEMQPRYRAVARAFLEKAINIEARYYPNADSSKTSFDEIIDRAFKFDKSE